MPELQYNDPDEVDSPADVSFPKHVHHFKVRAELSKLVDMDILDDDEADEIYDDWKDSRK